MNRTYHTFITVLAFAVSAVMFVATVTDFDGEEAQEHVEWSE